MGNPADMPLAINLQMDEQTRSQLTQTMSVVEIAEAHVIDSPVMADAANRELREIKARAKKIEELRRGFLSPAQQIIENAKALFNPAIEALGKAEGILKGRLLDWQTEQERIAAEKRREAEAEERRRRQEAEAKAAAERARAEEEARRRAEEARLAEEARRRAEEDARKAREEGDRKAAVEAERRAKTAAAERAKAEEAERAARERGEAKANETILAAAPTAPTTVVPEPVKVAGFSSRANWVADYEPGKDAESVKPLIVQAISSGRTDLLSLLKFDPSAANKLAAALKANFNVPGMRAVNRPVATSRAA